jgi:hypothetical protein
VQLGLAYVYGHGQVDSLKAALDEMPDESFAAERRLVALYSRDIDGLIARAVAQDTPADVLFAGHAHRLRGDEVAARQSFESVRVRLEPLVDAGWLEYAAGGGRMDLRAYDASRTLTPQLINLGMAYAGLGLRDQASVAAARILELARVTALAGTGRSTAAARIFAQAGFPEQALDLLEELSVTPTETTSHGLRLDPRWDPIRDHPRFHALLASRP